MERSAHDTYLATEVMTASPPKLHLMLIEAAIRFATQAGQLWRGQQDAEASGALHRAQELAGELLAGLDREAQPELAAKAAAVYMFVFRSLVEAGLQRDEAKLNDAVRVLEVERDTWRQLCAMFGARQDAQGISFDAPPPTPAPVAPGNPMVETGLLDDLPAGGFSLEA